jgi:hypothetical protein
MPEVLHLILKRDPFAQIAAGTKRTEYRDCTPYWRNRLEGRHYDVIHFHNGYATEAPEMLVEFAGLARHGKGRNAYYAIRLGRILKIKRWQKRTSAKSRHWPGLQQVNKNNTALDITGGGG